MVVDSPHPHDQRSLLGLRPPADLAEGTEPAGPVTRRAATAAEPTPPARPGYTVISSGWDSEDQEPRGKGSDLLTALRAGAVLVVLIVALALLLR